MYSFFFFSDFLGFLRFPREFQLRRRPAGWPGAWLLASWSWPDSQPTTSEWGQPASTLTASWLAKRNVFEATFLLIETMMKQMRLANEYAKPIKNSMSNSFFYWPYGGPPPWTFAKGGGSPPLNLCARQPAGRELKDVLSKITILEGNWRMSLAKSPFCKEIEGCP